MFWIDDDKDYIVTPETHFMGYECPFGQCDVLSMDHDMCRGIYQRISGVAGFNLPIEDWFERFQRNFDQFTKKSPNWHSDA